MPPINILSGEENIGKSTLCRIIIEYCKLKNIIVSGIRSELEIVNNLKTEINSYDIKTGEKVNLAVYSPGWDEKKPERKWKFNREALDWGNDVLRRAVPTDLLIIDEIGYLEIEKGEGWNACFNILESNQYKLALIVIRPELLPIASNRFKKVCIFDLQENNRKIIENKLIKQLVDLM
jgi:nucleoside-triphosphatase